MIRIDWHQLEKNAEAKEVSFEKFNYQIAMMKYSQFGRFEYYYNTPGSEFYMTLTRNCEELFAHAGDVIGWQVKFWLNKSADENSPLDTKHRNELLEGFKTSLAYKPTLKVWIICTPGLFSNTKTSCPVDQLEQDLRAIKSDISIVYWNKANYESIFHSAPEKFASIFNLYFSSNYLGCQLFLEHSGKRLDLLRKRYDTDLYTSSKEDKTVLTSIFYKDSLSNLHDLLKHILKDREILINSTFYKEAINTFLNPSSKNIPADKEKVTRVKNLLDKLLNLLGQLSVHAQQEDTIPFLKMLHSIIQSQGTVINSLISESDLNNNWYNRNYADYSPNDHSPNIENPQEFITHSHMVTLAFLDKVIKVYHLLSEITQQVYHVFAEAGLGKTNFVCSLTETLLNKDLPVLLIPASEIRGGGESIEKQILQFLNVDSSLSFPDLFGILDSLGFLHGIKIPIIIDGLNETQPSAAFWHPTITYISADIANRSNVMLITTCRNAYSKQVFGEDSTEDVPYSTIIEGFKENVDEAIRKYFKKYKIAPRNKDFSRDLFKNPLMLRIFCTVNQGKTAEITESNIYVAVDSYIDEMVTRISTLDGVLNPLTKNQVLQGIKAYSLSLWDGNITGVPYPDEVAGYFNLNGSGTSWQRTITYKIVDEGLLFRNIHADKEYAEFTHDLIGGFCIAKYAVFSNNKRDQILINLQSDALLRKLCSDNIENRHPLAEDILKAIIFLCPSYTGDELIKFTGNIEIARAHIRSLRMILSRTDGARIFIEHYKIISLDHPLLSLLLESVLGEILKGREHLELIKLLAVILLRCGPGQIDLHWSEVIRHRSEEIIRILNREMDLFEADTDQDGVEEILLFAALLLSSTDRLLRDTATKGLVTVGKKYPQQLWDVFLSLEEVNDLYILDRLLASVCGTFLQAENKILLADVCQYLEKRYFRQARTSHVYVLDYIDTLLRYAGATCGYKRTAWRPPPEQLLKWENDQECMQKVKDDNAAEWGFGPVDYEFAKYKIRSYVSKGWDKGSPLPPLTEALAQVVWRAKELGYSSERFESADISMNKERSGYRATDVQNYGKKYSKIAFSELYGSFLTEGALRDFRGHDGYRIEVTDIDPTFPRLPQKHQVITKCFLPTSVDAVQQWIVKEETPLLEDHCFKSDDMRTGGMDWVMLYGRLLQQGLGKSRIDIGTYSILISESKADKLLKQFSRNELSIRRFVIESRYTMAGEIPWSANFIDEETILQIDKMETEIYLPVTTYLRESKSGLKAAHDVKMPSKRLLVSLGLKINLDDFNFYSASNQIASRYFYDDYSSFLYLRANLLKRYLQVTKQSLIWIGISSKHGGFGEPSPAYNPSFTTHYKFRIFKS